MMNYSEKSKVRNFLAELNHKEGDDPKVNYLCDLYCVAELMGFTIRYNVEDGVFDCSRVQADAKGEYEAACFSVDPTGENWDYYESKLAAEVDAYVAEHGLDGLEGHEEILWFQIRELKERYESRGFEFEFDESDASFSVLAPTNRYREYSEMLYFMYAPSILTALPRWAEADLESMRAEIISKTIFAMINDNLARLCPKDWKTRPVTAGTDSHQPTVEEKLDSTLAWYDYLDQDRDDNSDFDEAGAEAQRKFRLTYADLGEFFDRHLAGLKTLQRHPYSDFGRVLEEYAGKICGGPIWIKLTTCNQDDLVGYRLQTTLDSSEDRGTRFYCLEDLGGGASHLRTLVLDLAKAGVVYYTWLGEK